MKRLLVGAMGIVALALGLVGGNASRAYTQDSITPVPSAQAVDAAPATVSAASDPLPAPDFARAYRHVFLAFAFAWVLIFGYAVLIDRRIASVSDELERLG